VSPSLTVSHDSLAAPRISLRAAAPLVVGLGVAALAVASLPGAGELREKLSGAAPGWVAVALALELASCLAFVLAFRGALGRRLPWGFSTKVGLTVQGTNVAVPTGGAGGLAVAGWALRKTGMPADRIARRSVALFLLTSSVNFVAAAIAGFALAAGVTGDVSPGLALVPALGAVLAIAAVVALPRFARAASGEAGGTGRLARWRSLARDTAVDGVRDAGLLLRRRDRLVLAGAIGYMAFDLLALTAAFEAVGAPPAAGALLLGYVVGQLGGLIPTPGGIGGTDGGLVGALALYGTPLAAAAAAVVLYRLFQLGVPALLGAISLASLPRALDRQARPAAAAPCEPMLAPRLVAA
jgi:uncharacterized membrane protein YbhN (UPF0104 family)